MKRGGFDAEGNQDDGSTMMDAAAVETGYKHIRDLSLSLSHSHVLSIRNRSGAVDADNVADRCPAERTVAAALAAPLLNRAGVAHAHVAAHVEHAVDAALVADGALARLAGESRLQTFAPLLQVGRRCVRRVRQGALQALIGDRVDVRGRTGAGHGAG